MPKYQITAEDGVLLGGKVLPRGAVIELDRGPHPEAWLRFKQAVEVKDPPAAESKKK